MAVADPDFFAEDPLTDGVSLIYGQDKCPVHSSDSFGNGVGQSSHSNGRHRENIDAIYPMDVNL